jgi:hypothetical protein
MCSLPFQLVALLAIVSVRVKPMTRAVVAVRLNDLVDGTTVHTCFAVGVSLQL